MTTTQCRLAILSLASAAALAVVFLLIPFMSSAQSATPATTSANSLIVEGEKTYNNVCIACHQAGGMGVKGVYPTLAGDPFVKLTDPKVVISTVLNGRGGMPRFDDSFSDEQIAAIVSYIRSAWGNNASAVTPDEVAAIRASFAATPAAGSPVANTAQGPQGETTPAAATPTP